MKGGRRRFLLVLFMTVLLVTPHLPTSLARHKPCHKPDLDCDMDVDVWDVQEAQNHWGCIEGWLCYDLNCDFDRNGKNDLQDILTVICWSGWSMEDGDWPWPYREFCECVPASRRCSGDEGPSPPKLRPPELMHVYFPTACNEFLMETKILSPRTEILLPGKGESSDEKKKDGRGG